MSWRLLSNSVSFQSPFNGATQTVTFPGSQWVAELSFENINDWESRQLEALIADLDGMGGRILIHDFGRWGRAPAGKPVVRGDANTGKLLTTQGWTPERKILWRGDYISIDNELKMITQDVWSGLDGSAILPVAPMLRTVPQAGTPIETANPRGVFRLADNENGVDRQPAFNNNVSLKFVEAF